MRKRQLKLKLITMISLMSLLYSQGHRITKNKKKDLLSPLDRFPTTHQDFYRKLKMSSSEEDTHYYY